METRKLVKDVYPEIAAALGRDDPKSAIKQRVILQKQNGWPKASTPLVDMEELGGNDYVQEIIKGYKFFNSGHRFGSEKVKGINFQGNPYSTYPESYTSTKAEALAKKVAAEISERAGKKAFDWQNLTFIAPSLGASGSRETIKMMDHYGLVTRDNREPSLYRINVENV